MLDPEKVKKDMRAFATRIHLMLENALGAAAGMADDTKAYPNLPTHTAMLQIYMVMVNLTRSIRAELVDTLGGQPQGEAQCRFYEEKMKEASFDYEHLEFELFKE